MADFFSGFASTWVPMYAQSLDNKDKQGAAGTFANALKGYKSAILPQQQDQLPPQPGQTVQNPVTGTTNPIAEAMKLYNLNQLGLIASVMPLGQGGNQPLWSVMPLVQDGNQPLWNNRSNQSGW